MGQLFEQKYPNNIRTISGLVNVIKQDDVVLLCDTSLGAVNIDLLSIPANYWSTQYKLYIIDKSNNANVNNITIVAGNTTDPNTGLPIPQYINGLSSIVINNNGGSYLLRVASNTNYVGQYSVVGGGGGGGGYNVIEDEGVALPQRNVLNFVGNNVSASDLGGKTVISIGGISVTSLTNAQYIALQTAGTLIQGQFYQITDALYTDGGVVIQALLNNAPPSVNGVGIHLNADYQGSGNYSGVVGFGAWKNIWCLPAIPVVAGDVVVWNNLHYKNLTGAWGSAPDGDGVNWEFLPKTTTNGYILEIDFIKYNVNTNSVIYRSDKRLNEVEFFSDISGVNLLLFQWGRNSVLGNKLSGASIINATNSYAQFLANVLESGKINDQTNRQESGKINNNTITQNSTLNLTDTKGEVVQNTIIGNSQIIALSGAKRVSLNSFVKGNVVSGNSEIRFDEVATGTELNYNELSENALIVLGTLSIGRINGNTISKGSGFSCPTVTADLERCVLSNKTTINVPTWTINTSNKRALSGFSNFEHILDFADPLVWELVNQKLIIPNNRSYVGIFVCSNTGGVTVLKIANTPTTHKCTFKPSSVDTFTVQHTLVGVAVADNLCCDAPASSNILVGRVNGCDFVEYELSGNLNIRTNLVKLA